MYKGWVPAYQVSTSVDTVSVVRKKAYQITVDHVEPTYGHVVVPSSSCHL